MADGALAAAGWVGGLRDEAPEFLPLVFLEHQVERFASELVGAAVGALDQRAQPRRLRIIAVEVDPGLDLVILDPAMQLPIAAGEMVMDFLLTKPVVAQVIQARVREARVERAQVRQVKRVVIAVVDRGEEAHQAPDLAAGRILADRRLDDLERRPRALHDGFGALLERLSALELPAADDFSPSRMEFSALNLVHDFEREGDLVRHGARTPRWEIEGRLYRDKICYQYLKAPRWGIRYARSFMGMSAPLKSIPKTTGSCLAVHTEWIYGSLRSKIGTL